MPVRFARRGAYAPLLRSFTALHSRRGLLVVLGLVSSSVLPVTTFAAASETSAWNGSWRVDLARSSPAAKDGVPAVYRFNIDDGGAITWEIPELGEVVRGRTDGRPMTIHRSQPTPGLTLAVKAISPRELTYEVANDGKVVGGGRMMLVDDASAWVDLTWGPEGPGFGAELVYRRI